MLKPEIENFRLGVVTADPTNGVSLMRALGPFLEMAREDRRLQIIQPPRDAAGHYRYSWDFLGAIDALFMSAPYTPQQADAVRLAKQMGLKVWLDWDDDVTCVPAYNPRARFFPPEQTKPMVEMMVNLADLVTVSTEEIKRRRSEGRALLPQRPDQSGRALLPQCPNQNPADMGGAAATALPGNKIHVFPNACQWPFMNAPRQRRVTWRGGDSHDGDLTDVLPGLLSLIKLPQFCLWKWMFIGEPPWQVFDALAEHPNFEHDGGGDPCLFMSIFGVLAPYVHIVPLHGNRFNHCRSNLAWLEATSAGAAVLAPDWEEWHRPGIVNYEDDADFTVKLRRMLETFKDGAMHPNVAMSRKFIAENLLLPQINAKRWAILNAFAKQGGAKLPLCPDQTEEAA